VETQVIRVNRSLFRRMLEEYPETAAALHQQLSVRLCNLLDQIGDLEERFSDD
jgi:CRP-like cAMP-binding protein